ncbi:hypothetical protein WA026_016653 [Henosepilachna vigintioctopunctata]|uniref:Uncharacterized protein n=1 Tax=Henosepilachna vigintioctopunctata TaxID=420089 RepID=A0AAW1V2S4_9CUCU
MGQVGPVMSGFFDETPHFYNAREMQAKAEKLFLKSLVVFEKTRVIISGHGPGISKKGSIVLKSQIFRQNTICRTAPGRHAIYDKSGEFRADNNKVFDRKCNKVYNE